MNSTIILPTYNERENLAGIIKEIFKVGIENLKIIVVDDNSPDGTGQLADELAKRYPKVSVLHRTLKEGLGKAYIAGFQQALSDSDCGFIFEMDADFSHQPKYLPHFLDRIQEADLVLGSRYIAKGGVENWGLVRRYISKFANLIIRLILRVPISDLTGGFKCFRREVLEKLDFERIESSGYNFQIEINYKVYKEHFRVVEIPIIFIERRAGKSKFNVAIMLESCWKVLVLKFFRKE